MLKNAIALLTVLFVSATNVLTEEEPEKYRQRLELEHIDGTIKYINDRCKDATVNYDKLFRASADEGILINTNEIANMDTVVSQARRDMEALKKTVPTNNEKCAKYETDVEAKKQEADNELNECIMDNFKQVSESFDRLKKLKVEALGEMKSIRDELTVCVNNQTVNLTSNHTDIDYCEYRMKWSIIKCRSTFDTDANLVILSSEYFYKHMDRRINYCTYRYGEINFSEVTKAIVKDFADCLKSVE